MYAFISMLMLHLGIFLLWSCVNVVFKHDCRPSSLGSINLASFSYVFMLHWLVYKLCNALNFSCAIRVIDLGIDMVF
jgi:ascorbate-specific PTS system EIIC-type component UlaA